MERIVNNSGKKRRITPGSIILIVLIVSLVAGALYADNNRLQRNDPVIKYGEITRSYESLLRGLEQDPGNIGEAPYIPHMPEIVQKDIQIMFESEEDLRILYYKADKSSCITISKDRDTEGGIILTVDTVLYSYTISETYYKDISIYKDGNHICVYGAYMGGRMIMKSELNMEGDDDARVYIENRYMDLFGVDEEFDVIRYFNKDSTLTKRGKEFKLYLNGNVLGEPVEFPGVAIVDFSYYYVLDENRDLYYMYYCSNLENPWIKFPIVAQDIDHVASDKFLETSVDTYRIKFPIFIKEGIAYVGIVDADIERQYGQNYGSGRSEASDDNFEIPISVHELSINTVSRVILTQKWQSYPSKDWYLRYEFDFDGNVYYIERRVNGLDSYLLSSMSDEEVQPFVDRKMKPDEVEGVLEELRLLYKKYE